jgi:shikimate kinase
VVLAELAAAQRAARVVSLGGGAVTDGDVPPRVLFTRASGSERPLARDEDSFVALYERRRPLYEACATLRLLNDGCRTADEVAAELAEAVA